MATKTDFSEAEWDQLHKGAAGAGLLVSVSDRSFFDSFKEAGRWPSTWPGRARRPTASWCASCRRSTAPDSG